MQQHGSKYFPVRPLSPSDPGVGLKGQNSTFWNMVMLNIEYKGMTNTATSKYKFCPYTPP